MRLVRIAAGEAELPVKRIAQDAELAHDIQAQLSQAGLLDPPADGEFGAVSHWALAEFLAHWGLQGAPWIDRPVASALLQADASFPLVPGDDFAGDVVHAMQSAGLWLCRHPKALNIVYVEGMGPHGQAIATAPGGFGDLRLLLRVGEHGQPEIAGAWEARIETGRSGDEPSERIVHGQFKACSVGTAGVLARSASGQREFLSMLRRDPREAASPGYCFMTTVLSAGAVLAARRRTQLTAS